MNLLWASTFTDALGRLTQQEQKHVKLTATDLLFDPKGNGLQLHRVEASAGFWTVRVNQDLRIVLHKDGEHTLLAWVGHHDDAYRWAERRRLVPHERTGAMQFVEVVETTQDFGLERSTCDGYLPAPQGQEPILAAALPSRPFSELSNDQLLDVGVPREWLEPVRDALATDVDELFERLPAEAAEALLDYATGGRIEDHVVPHAVPGSDPFAHPDAQRRFRVLDNVEELRAALDQPFAKWAVFLHPVQRALVDRNWSGPVRVTGSAGTGKTIVALHRAVHIARSDPTAQVLLTTFSKRLAAALQSKCNMLTETEPALRSRILVRTLDQAAFELYTARFGQPSMVNTALVQTAVDDAKKVGLAKALSSAFLVEEWNEVVDAWHVADLATYATVPRLGRRTRLGSQQREAAWSVFTLVRERMAQRRVVTWPGLYARLGDELLSGPPSPYTHVVVDEAQDLSVAQVRFLGAISTKLRPNALFLAGDVGQRIFHLPFSWVRLGLDIRGRSHALKVNYRTSHQIREMADRLLPATIADLDGIEEGRRGTISIFDGPPAQIALADDEVEERDLVATFLEDAIASGITAAEIGVLVRSERQLGRARNAVGAAGFDYRDLSSPTIAIMHDAKGLEFQAVVVMACDEEIIPDQERLTALGDVADLEAAYDTERHLLYVACTRARDRLLVSGVAPGSEFLDDIRRS